MKLTRYTPSSCGSSGLARAAGFDQFLRNPFAGYQAMNSLFDLGSFFGNAAGVQLATDVFEDADNFYARFEVPGVKKEDVKLDLNNGLLSVTVEKREKSESGEQVRTATRSLSVPESVATDKVGAKLEDGVLTVTLPKQEDRKPRSIQVA